MNRNNRAIALILVIVFLLVVCTLAFSVMVLFQNQQAITRSLIQLDEVRYAKETGRRVALSVWRYKYDDEDYLDSGNKVYEATIAIDGYNVESVSIRVEDKERPPDPPNRKLEDDEIEITVNRKSWSL